MSLVLTDVISAFGNYMKSGQGLQNLNQKMFFNGTKTIQEMTAMQHDQLVYRSAEVLDNTFAQNYQVAFTPTGTTNFDPQETVLQQIKFERQIVPHDISSTWLGFLRANAQDPREFPLLAWWLTSVAIPKFWENFELYEIYKGVRGAITPGTPTARGAAMNGLRNKINALITAGDITPIATGAMTGTNQQIYEKVETFVEGIAEQYKTMQMNLCMAPELLRKVVRGMNDKYNANYSQQDLNYVWGYPNIGLVGLPSMIGATKIWATPKENIKYLSYLSSPIDTPSLVVQAADRAVKMFADWYVNIHIEIPSIFFTNDVELV